VTGTWTDDDGEDRAFTGDWIAKYEIEGQDSDGNGCNPEID
jgi:hypothetical protein